MNPLKILLVEDNTVVRWWLRSALEEAGFIVSSADSAEEARWMSACLPFDLLITDWHLPGGHDGFEVLAQLRESRPGVQSVLISGDADAQLVERAWQSGFNLVLKKPLRLPEIIEAVQALAKKEKAGVGHEAA